MFSTTPFTRLMTVLSMMTMAIVPCAGAPHRVYVADIAPLSGSGVSGAVTVFEASPTRVAYAGFAEGLAPNLGGAGTCTAANGCGVHIHSGISCAPSGQGGHYFEAPVTSDPWTDERYTSDASGVGTYEGILEMGTNDLAGRAFVVHNDVGSRVGCGLLMEVTDDALSATIDPLTNAGVMGEVTLATGVGGAGSARECFYGTATSLTTNIVAGPGLDCTSTNGCGTHIHSGDDCTNNPTQGGHYYTGTSDPWTTVGYLSTDSSGDAEYVHCVITGETEFTGKTFLIHEDDGGRVGCGILEEAEDELLCS